MLLMIISFLLLCGVRGSLVYNSKEIVVLQMLLLIVVLIGWKYTKIFFNNVSGIGNTFVKIQYSMCMIFVVGGSRFGGVELMTIIIMVGGLIPVLNS